MFGASLNFSRAIATKYHFQEFCERFLAANAFFIVFNLNMQFFKGNDKNRSPRALRTPKPDLTQSPILGLDRLIAHLQSMPKVPEITASKEVAFKNNQKMSQALNSIQYADKFRTNSLRSKYNSNFSNETANTNSDYQGRDFSSADFVLRNNEKEG